MRKLRPGRPESLWNRSMSMAKCYECRTEVSSRAKACPKCGARGPARPKAAVVLMGVAKFVFGLGLFLTAASCMVGMCAAL